jgi:hypothetical protein
MRRNYRTKLGLGYDEAKFNYLNNSQFSCFYLQYVYKKKKEGVSSITISPPIEDPPQVLVKISIDLS